MRSFTMALAGTALPAASVDVHAFGGKTSRVDRLLEANPVTR